MHIKNSYENVYVIVIFLYPTYHQLIHLSMKIFNEFLNFYAVAFHGKSYSFIKALPLAVKR